eukprot:sb/3473063/
MPRNKPPPSKDWRVDGVVTKVKNQASCGACYAFASHSASCVSPPVPPGLTRPPFPPGSGSGNDGCKGGRMTNTFKYVSSAGGIQTENSYPYTGKEGDCKFSPSSVAAVASGYMDLGAEKITEVMLKRFVGTVGPMAAGIDASHRSLQFYTGLFVICS